MRIVLKEIECLSYNMEDQDILRQLSMDLQVVWNKYSKSVPMQRTRSDCSPKGHQQ